MSEANRIEIDQIIVRDRSRDLDRSWAAALAASFKESEMVNPITLWRDGDEAVLVAGLHRIEAHLINGDTEIECRWSQAETLADAKILETSENLLRHELTALDRAQHLAALKVAYEEKYPETKGGVAGALAKHGSAKGIIPFAEDAADKVGLSGSAITKAVAMWNGLSFATKAAVKNTWLADHQAGLMQLSKEKANRQAKALALIFPGEGKKVKATNVADALHILENGRLATSVEKRFVGLNKTLKSLEDEELYAVLDANEQRILAWVETRGSAAQ